ncbi:MAG: hypothetical protein QW057_02135 [Candidatus Bathyarchaeia archaeon]
MSTIVPGASPIKGGDAERALRSRRPSRSNGENEFEKALSILNSQMRELAETRAMLVKEADLLRGERDRLNDEHREAVGRLRELRSRERKNREQIDELRGKIAEERKQLEAARNESQQLTEQVAQAKSEVKTRPEDVENELRQLDWELQTSPTDMVREKELMKRVRELSVEQRRHEKIGELELLQAGARAKQLGFRLSLDRDWAALKELLKARDSLRAELTELMTEVASLKSKADEAHKRYLDKRASIDSLSAKMKETALEIRGLRDRVAARRREEEAKRQEEERSKLRALAEETKRKLERGEKITLQELQALSVDEEE